MVENITKLSATFLESISCKDRERKLQSKGDDLVWILYDFSPCGLWPLAKVMEIYPGSDKIVRPVIIKTAYGEKMRQVAKLSKFSVE